MFEFFYRFRDMLRLRKAVAMADKAHARTGDRYYVMPAGDETLVVVDRRNFRILRRKHYVDRAASVRDLVDGSFYFTPCRDGSGELPPDVVAMKRRMYLAWEGERRKERRAARRAARKAMREARREARRQRREHR